jgi:hypothetical protein
VSDVEKKQREVCDKYGAEFSPAKPQEKVGIALETLGQEPLNALRHPPQGDTCGWYIWGGVELSKTDDFFKPLHVQHLEVKCPEITPFLGLAPGWRVLLAREHTEVWYDESLLHYRSNYRVDQTRCDVAPFPVTSLPRPIALDE